MKKWFIKNKILLIAFGITTVVLAFVTYYQLSFILQHLPELQRYAETQVITEPLSKYGTIGIFNLAVFGVWVVLLVLILWKALFPSKESAKNAFHIHNMEYIMKLPSSIRRELKK
ncbi:hypothetical protein Q5W88_21610 [Shouchella clausii]|uniref:hypothetical protein n=1 Tax=Shouchella clausii TaxID=79880 RepID=UPI0026F4379F|nr:hypothetical protein [Shouchella clausii]MDO7285904.1 hypothetical protein [Shouchella clausii]MDO7305807.1 hypothetical protein [Shouchella clausii]